jgi:hypothetical protein
VGSDIFVMFFDLKILPNCKNLKHCALLKVSENGSNEKSTELHDKTYISILWIDRGI